MPVLQCNGANIYYEERGEGNPIVFLHGAWAGVRYFQPQLDGLSAEYRTIAFDFRGHGRSEKTKAGHTVAQYARDLEAFLERLSLDDAVIVGWSLGALVAWEYVDRFGTDRVRALVNVDMEPSPGQWTDGSEGRYDAGRLSAIHEAIQENHWGFIDGMLVDLLKDPPSGAMREMMFDEATRCPPAIKSSIILDATTSDYAEVLPDVDVPSLVCAGEDETWRSVAAVQEAESLLSDVRLERFEDSGHVPTIEEPERFNEAMREFVDSL